MTNSRPFEPVPTPVIGVGSRLLVGHYPDEPGIVVAVVPSRGDDSPYYRVQVGTNITISVGGGLPHPVIPWLWTREHGRWVGQDPEPEPPYIPNYSARCAGPAMCETCAHDLERLRAGDW